jgi:hypothetical protein
VDTLIDLLRDTGATGLVTLPVDDAGWAEAATSPPGIVRVGCHRDGLLPVLRLDAFDILLTREPDAPAPWVTVGDIEAEAAHLRAVAADQPLAATVAAQVHRLTLALDFDAAMLLESLAYSTLLASEGFRRWHAAMPPQRGRVDGGPRVRTERLAERLEIILDRPRGRNAIDAAMRDALSEALEFAALDPDRAPVLLRGEGAVFSVGGDLAEFGQAGDPASAHAIRSLRSPARLLHAVAARATAQVHGPLVGGGVEIAMAASRVVARPRTSFRLPEVSMGLIPGAGGTATVPRRIGRHRACWMALSGREIDLATAQRWGLVDAVEE